MDTDPLIPDEDTSPYDDMVDFPHGSVAAWRASVGFIVENAWAVGVKASGTTSAD